MLARSAAHVSRGASYPRAVPAMRSGQISADISPRSAQHGHLHDGGWIPADISPQCAQRPTRVVARAALVAVVATAALWASAATPSAADTWRWPIRGGVLTDFANAGGPYADGQHRGIDVAAAAGTPVTAAVSGHVRFAGLVGSSGLTVSVRTANGRFDVSYLHLATTSVRSGQTVAPGQRIGAVGTSGRRSKAAPHLHFGVRDAGTRRYRDPLDFLPPLPGVREVPRPLPIAVRGPVRVGPAPRPVRLPWPERAPLAARVPPAAAGPSRAGWAIACGALIAAAALAGGVAGQRRVRAVAGVLPSFGGR